MEKEIERTKSLRKKYHILAIISWVLCYGICAFLIIAALAGHPIAAANAGGIAALKEKYGTLLVSFGSTLLIVAALSIVVKDKIEPTVWMVNVILSGYLYNMVMVYIVFGIWFVDTYIIKALKRRFKTKYIINKEIDRRL